MRVTLFTLLLAALAAFSAGMFGREYRAFGSAGAPLGPLGLSWQAVEHQLRNCTQRLMPPAIGLLPAAERRQIAARCGTRAGRVLSRMPTNGLAHLVNALAAWQQGRRTASWQALAASARFAPREGWIAERRFVLAQQLAAKSGMPPTARKAARRDIGVLLSTRSGAELLSRYYALRPPVRVEIANVLGLAGKAEQQRFLNQLAKRAAGS